jgi:hypothetical protein
VPTWNQATRTAYHSSCGARELQQPAFRWRDKEDENIPVRLEATPAQFGGRRWWFICPLIMRRVPCNRRAGKLYLPPRARHFGCRKCHDLTYRSCQEAHQAERLFDRLGFDVQVAKLWDRMHRRK